MSNIFWDKCVHVTGDVDAWITLRWRLCAASSTAGTMSSAGSPSPSARPGGYQDRTRTPAGEQEVTGVVKTCREQTGSTGFYRVLQGLDPFTDACPSADVGPVPAGLFVRGHQDQVLAPEVPAVS